MSIETHDRKEDVKPDSMGDVSGPAWKYVARKTLRKFGNDQCTDMAASLTYFGVLALFPAVIAILSLLGVFGQGTKTIDTILTIVSNIGGSSIADSLRSPLMSLSQTQGAGITLIIGLLAALWSASGYIGAFSRAMNRIYEIGEGRPIWKLKPVMLLITLVTVVLAVFAALILVLSGPVLAEIGSQLGLGSTVLLIWKIAKWPVLLLIVVFITAFLYYTTPNVKQPKFKWISLGAVVAIVVWILASAAFGFYLSNFSSYNKTYGSLAGAIAFLLWLWITNVALLFGAELNAELERSRELQAGIVAEETIQLSPRDTSGIDKADKKHAEDLAEGRALRRRRPR